MRVIWSLGEARVDDKVAQISRRQDWTPATVKTLLGQLVKKKRLEAEKSGRAFIYRARVDEEDAVRLLTEELLARVYATKQVQVLFDAVDLSNLTEEDAAVLAEKLQQKPTAETVECA